MVSALFRFADRPRQLNGRLARHTGRIWNKPGYIHLKRFSAIFGAASSLWPPMLESIVVIQPGGQRPANRLRRWNGGLGFQPASLEMRTMANMYCNQCGRVLPPTSRFCNGCGAAVVT